MTLHPNVKINLGLNVLRKREDGYHDLDTLFVPYFGIADMLEIEPAAELCITIEKEGGVDWDPMSDLTVKAWRLLHEDFGITPVSIHLVKNAPVGAGLGGGSSDAAFMLKGLNEMFSLGLSAPSLASYAARLGSDCSFFIYNRPMMGSGRGEILSEYHSPSVDALDYGQGITGAEWKLELICPEGVSVSTADAYRGIVPAIPQTPLRDVLAQDICSWKGSLVNDFEATVFKKYPVLAQIKEQLYRDGAVYASMSGSGSALYRIVKA